MNKRRKLSFCREKSLFFLLSSGPQISFIIIIYWSIVDYKWKEEKMRDLLLLFEGKFVGKLMVDFWKNDEDLRRFTCWQIGSLKMIKWSGFQNVSPG